MTMTQNSGQTGAKTALITGASSGFGLLTSVTLARRGWHVLATMRDLNRRGAAWGRGRGAGGGGGGGGGISGGGRDQCGADCGDCGPGCEAGCAAACAGEQCRVCAAGVCGRRDRCRVAGPV